MNKLLAELVDTQNAAIGQRRAIERQVREADIPSVKSQYYAQVRYWQGVADGYGGACDIVNDSRPLIGPDDQQMQEWNQDRNEC